MTKNTETWMTIEEAAIELNVSTKTIRRYITQGRIAANRVGPRLIRVARSSVVTVGNPIHKPEVVERDIATILAGAGFTVAQVGAYVAARVHEHDRSLS